MFSADSATLGLTATERVHIGRRAADALAEEVTTLNAKRVFLLVSSTLRSQTDEISLIESALGDSVAAVFDGIGPHGPRTDVLKAMEAARSCDADLSNSVLLLPRF
jgi:maleylacetate reductase